MSYREPLILIIDSYDSFTNNLAALCRKAIPSCRLHIAQNDAISYEELVNIMPFLSAIIVGPGPGSPANPSDVGILNHLWKLPSDIIVPIFGVCLGLQSLSIAFGAQLRQLHVVKHGLISRIHHTGQELFKGVGDAHAVRYHSLHVELVDGGEIERLAWADDGKENGHVVMAVKHVFKPFWAVQYHPESVCTSGGGIEVLQNFWRLARNWNCAHGREPRLWDPTFSHIIGSSWPYLRPHSPPNTPSASSSPIVNTAALYLPDVSLYRLCEAFGANDESSPFVLLESSADPGRFSILGVLSSDSIRITYAVGDNHVRLFTGMEWHSENIGHHDIWSWIATFMRSRRAHGGAPEIPFWGGLIGYLSYEIGVDTLSVPCASGARQHPDVNLVFVERSIVLDKSNGRMYIQSIKPNDQAWCTDIVSRLLALSGDKHLQVQRQRPIFTKQPVIRLPNESLYKARIRQAQEHLSTGNSYELCLTAPTTISIPARSLSSPSASWEMYRLLQSKNPAPHAGYIRLHPSTLVSSSPERFLSFSRPPYTSCQLRPIKGTVRKGPGITRSVAEKALAGSTKEVAENLMIVDLIRHDLHGVVGDHVEVKQFCSVEEYETVWQLVSVIEGQLTQEPSGTPDLDSEGELGWEVLRRSLPPGSMTGAPKKRSVEIMQTLEDGPRSIYSGVFGYWCVGGGGDWSVVIRSCFKYDERFGYPDGPDEDRGPSGARATRTTDEGKEEWTIGAGGAITALSDPEAEWDEMVVKLQTVLRTFESAAS